MSAAAAAVGTTALNTGKAILTSKLFWIGLAVLIAVLIVYAKYARIRAWLQGIFGKDHGDYQPGAITEERKAQLEAFARELHASMYGVDWSGDRVGLLRELVAINDNERRYVATYYADALTRGNSLREDIDAELLPLTDLDEEAMNLLAALNL